MQAQILNMQNDDGKIIALMKILDLATHDRKVNELHKWVEKQRQRQEKYNA